MGDEAVVFMVMEGVLLTSAGLGSPPASSPWLRVSHRFDHHLAETQNTVVHP
jgi:hypothetical protein